MPRAFPNTFDIDELKGPKAVRLKSDFRDARAAIFQEIVGDAIRSSGNSSVSVQPLESPDGGIDIYVQRNGGNCEWLNALPMPAIVECKSISTGDAGFTGRVKSAWQQTLGRTKDKSRRGWVGIDAPWQEAKSYVFAVSGRFSAVDHKLKIQDRIQRDLGSLANRAAVEHIEVIDWAFIRSLLERDQRLVDQWLGSAIPGLLSHDEYLYSLRVLSRSRDAGLPPFKTMVLPENLKFVEPERTDRLLPQNVFAEVSAMSNDAGLLLIGPGGVGKSRTLLEVSHIANAAGWRVLHVLPSDPPVENDVLFDEVGRSAEPVLVVVDYIEQTVLNFAGIRLQLFPEMIQRGRRVAFLASARPGYRHRRQEWQPVFVDLPFRPDAARNVEICNAIFDSAAPTAVTAVGRQKLLSVVGSRPVMALLIGREIERQMREETNDDWAILRDAELTDWLGKRLSSDGLLHRAEEIATPFGEKRDPSPHLLAAAAALASLPQPEAEVLEATASVLRAAAPGNSAEWIGVSSREVVTALRALGWVDAEDWQLVSAHDVVADEVLQSVIRSTYSHEVRGDLLGKVLSAAATSARSFGRFGRALSRLLKQSQEEKTFDVSLRTAANDWLTRSAAILSDRLLNANPEEAAYALGAVLSEEPWAEQVPLVWETLVEPWLLAHGRSFPARHLLYRALKRLPRAQAQKLESIAVEWLENFRHTDSAAWIIAPLLARPRLASEATTSIARQWALEWIDKHVQPETCTLPSAYVIAALLRGERSSSKVVAKAFIWLQRHGTRAEANLLLQQLLNARLTKAEQGKVLSVTERWLETYGTRWNAGAILDAAISRRDLSKERLRRLTEPALGWIRQWWATADISDLLQSLSRLRDVDPELSGQLRTFSEEWVGAHLDRFDVRSVLRLLLQSLLLDNDGDPAVAEIYDRVESGRGTLAEATGRALQTLRFDAARLSPGLHEYAQGVVINTLIRWPQAKDAASIDVGVAWASEHPDTINADFVLTALLNRLPAGHAAVPQVLVAARTWLVTYSGTPVDATSAHLIGAVLGRREDLGTTEIGDWVDWAVAWIQRNIHSSHALLVQDLLKRTDLGESLDDALRAGASWLAHHPDNPDVYRVIKLLLSRLRTAGSTSARDLVVKRCSDWVFAHTTHPYPRYYAPICQQLRPFLDRTVPIVVPTDEPRRVVPDWRRLRSFLRAHRDDPSRPLSRELLELSLDNIEAAGTGDGVFEAVLPFALTMAHVIGDEDLIARSQDLVSSGLHTIADRSRLYTFAKLCKQSITDRLWTGISAPLHYLNALQIPYLNSRDPSHPKPAGDGSESPAEEPVQPAGMGSVAEQIVAVARRGLPELRKFGAELSRREEVSNADVAVAIETVARLHELKHLGSRLAAVIGEAGFVTPAEYTRTRPAEPGAAAAWGVFTARARATRSRYQGMIQLLREETWRLAGLDSGAGHLPVDLALLTSTLDLIEGDVDAVLESRGRHLAARLWLLGDISRDAPTCDRARRWTECVFAHIGRNQARQQAFISAVKSLATIALWEKHASPELRSFALGLAEMPKVRPTRSSKTLLALPFRLTHSRRDIDCDEFFECIQWAPDTIVAQALHPFVELVIQCGVFDRFRDPIAAMLYHLAARTLTHEAEPVTLGATYVRWQQLSGRELAAVSADRSAALSSQASVVS